MGARGQFAGISSFLSFIVWVPESELRVSGLVAVTFCPLSHPTGLQDPIIVFYVPQGPDARASSVIHVMNQGTGTPGRGSFSLWFSKCMKSQLMG